MKLIEIRQRVIEANKLQEGESWEDFAERKFNSLPRIPYGELPKSLKEEVRKRVSINSLRKWLEETQTWLESENAGDFAWMKGRLDEVLAVDPKEEDPETARQGKVERLLVRVRNTATYIIDAAGPIGKGNPELVPDLYQVCAMRALELLLKKSGKDNTQPFALPQPAGISGGSRQKIISDLTYSNAFNVRPLKGKPYLAKMTGDFFESITMDDIVFDPKGQGKQPFTTSYEDAEKLDKPLVNQIFTAISRAGLSIDGYMVTIDFPKFLGEMGKRGSGNYGENAKYVLNKIKELEQFVGYLPTTGQFHRLLTFQGYDVNTKTMQLAVPYMVAVYRTLENKRLESGTRKNGETWQYHKPVYNELCHASLASERNKAAVDLVQEITNRMLQHGTTPDAMGSRKRDMAEVIDPEIITICPTFRQLVNSSDLLRGRLRRNKEPNKALSRAFAKAYQLLRTKTDAYQYYRELNVMSVIPTMDTLDGKLVMTHKGRNPNFVRVS